jgi:hypothetical protein
MSGWHQNCGNCENFYNCFGAKELRRNIITSDEIDGLCAAVNSKLLKSKNTVNGILQFRSVAESPRGAIN